MSKPEIDSPPPPEVPEEPEILINVSFTPLLYSGMFSRPDLNLFIRNFITHPSRPQPVRPNAAKC